MGEKPLFLIGDNVGPTDDRRGNRPLKPDREIDWSFFFKTGEDAPQPSRLIDTHLSPSLFDLPGRAEDTIQSLPLMNLLIKASAAGVQVGKTLVVDKRGRSRRP